MPRDTDPIAADAKLIRDESASTRVSRRTLVKGSGVLVATSVVGAGAAGCTNTITGRVIPVTPTPVPVAEQYPVPPAPETPPEPGELAFFTEAEARTLDALVATILPGDADDPGAREAGVVNYIDHLLAEFPGGFAQPIYRDGPFAEPYQGEEPPAAGEEFEVIWVRSDLLPRYGYQTFLTPAEIYRLGLEYVDRLARSRYGGRFADLQAGQQDEIARMLAEGEVAAGTGGGQPQGAGAGAGDGDGEDEGYYPPSLQDFFEVVRGHIVEGMFGDPAYGGNQNMAGWRLIGYPGAQRAYTPREMRTPGLGLRLEPQPLEELPPFNPGVRLPVPGEDHVVLPVSGSDPWSGETGFDRGEGH